MTHLQACECCEWVHCRCRQGSSQELTKCPAVRVKLQGSQVGGQHVTSTDVQIACIAGRPQLLQTVQKAGITD